MQNNLQALLQEIRELERSVIEQSKLKEEELLFKIKNQKIVFENEIKEKHKALRTSAIRFLAETSLISYLIAPVVYSMIIPAVIMDLFVSFYQMVCFPVFRIPKVHRKEYISLDKYKLKYLNWIERINCDFCGYFNGVIGYAREVASRTEQYFCPIKHALKTRGLHSRHARFLTYGDPTDLHEKFAQLRKEVRETQLKI